MKAGHVVANVLVAVVIAIVFWGIPDDLAWLRRFLLVTALFGIVGILVYIAVRFRVTPSD